MIYKSYLVEENTDILKNNLVLIYGENLGLINDLKSKILKKEQKNRILKFNQDEILKKENTFYEEINNKSLFEDKKVFFIDNVNDKFLKIVEQIRLLTNENKIYLYSDLLEKKSKLRNFFEKDKKTDIVPCYQDNEITIKKIISEKLKNYDGLTVPIINAIIESCGNNRTKIRNEISKIKTFFNGSPLNYDNLSKLLNIKENDEFNFVRDSAIAGNKKKTGEYLDSTVFEIEKTTYYLSNLNQRLIKLREVVKSKKNLEQSINEIRPPIFWKDKSTFLLQARNWNIKKLDEALKKVYNTEIRLKSNSDINRNTILKSLIIEICNLATAS